MYSVGVTEGMTPRLWRRMNATNHSIEDSSTTAILESGSRTRGGRAGLWSNGDMGRSIGNKLSECIWRTRVKICYWSERMLFRMRGLCRIF
ncbi:hypothetical protein KC19_VG316200 [Ceratodon purpureus]|uniref:Uncharacterized protein n=1 Tax=Ceratodon purpureus TaxID=3225 RepID=A0A8T0HXH4_CERPU|nr:hypothetical protein KC19_VG316200 [Ceratodon purpureus]